MAQVLNRIAALTEYRRGARKGGDGEAMRERRGDKGDERRCESESEEGRMR
jgi:hypothetical protein